MHHVIELWSHTRTHTQMITHTHTRRFLNFALWSRSLWCTGCSDDVAGGHLFVVNIQNCSSYWYIIYLKLGRSKNPGSNEVNKFCDMWVRSSWRTSCRRADTHSRALWLHTTTHVWAHTVLTDMHTKREQICIYVMKKHTQTCIHTHKGAFRRTKRSKLLHIRTHAHTHADNSTSMLSLDWAAFVIFTFL